MERLNINDKYNPLEIAIHLARYSMVKNLCKDKNILDVACGQGYGAFLMKQWGAKKVTGLDISDEAISVSTMINKKNNNEFVTCDLTKQLPYKDKSFDLIISLETIEHLENTEMFLNEIKRLIKDDGIIIVSCPNDHFYYGSKESNPYHKRKYTFDEFQNMSQLYLGNNVKYYGGIRCSGFMTHRISQEIVANDFDGLTKYNDIRSMEIAPETNLHYDDCNYYVGVWNGDINLNAVIYGNNDNKDIDALISSLNDKIANNYKHNEKVSKLNDKIEKLEQVNSVLSYQLSEVNKYNSHILSEKERILNEKNSLFEEKNHYEYLYNTIINSNSYKVARKIVRVVKRK